MVLLLRKVERGRCREVSLRWLWIVFLSCGKGIGSLTRERSRWVRLRHLESEGRLLELLHVSIQELLQGIGESSRIRKRHPRRNKHLQVPFDAAQQPRREAIGAVVDEPAQVQPPHKPAQVPFALARRNWRTHRLGESLERHSAVDQRLLVQKCYRGRVPLTRYQTAGVQGALAAAWDSIICGDEEDDEDQDFGGEVDWRGHGGGEPCCCVDDAVVVEEEEKKRRDEGGVMSLDLRCSWPFLALYCYTFTPSPLHSTPTTPHNETPIALALRRLLATRLHPLLSRPRLLSQSVPDCQFPAANPRLCLCLRVSMFVLCPSK